MNTTEHDSNSNVTEEKSNEIQINSNSNLNDTSINSNVETKKNITDNKQNNLNDDKVIPNVENNLNESLKNNIKKDNISNITKEKTRQEETVNVKENNINNINDNDNNNQKSPVSSKEKMKEPAKDSEENKVEINDKNLSENITKEQKTIDTTTDNKTKLNNVEENTYKLKAIEKRNFEGVIQQKNIITQNINGPCPLLALCNILILRGDISISLKKSEITYEEIIDILGDYIARCTGNFENDNNANNNNDNNEYNFQDVLDIIPTLKKGLDINVKFDSVLSFEPSPAQTVFKYFNIKLVHGWTVDPEDKETYRIIVNECGNYNKVVEKIIESESACASKEDLNASQDSINTKNKKEELYHTGIVCKNFIESNASQLTYHGLTSIPDVLRVGEPTAFFRNNHFLTLIKAEDNNMYTLVTDQGFVNEKKIVWESLSTIDGDSIFVDGLFKKYSERPNNDLILNSPNEE